MYGTLIMASARRIVGVNFVIHTIGDERPMEALR